MHYKLFVLLIITGFFTSSCFSEKVTSNLSIVGNVIQSESRLPLVYVNIGILNKPLGTVTDSTGSFAFNIDENNLHDTILVSLIGFDSRKIAVQDFIHASSKTITLSQKVIILSEVRIENYRKNEEIIGRQRSGKFIQMSIHNKNSADQTIGSEMGMRFRNNHTNSYLKDFNFYLSVNNFDYIKFRLNLYSVLKNMPDTLIFNRQIITQVDNFKIGWIKVPLNQFNIKVPFDFIITLQWVDSKMEKKERPLTVIPVVPEPFTKNCFIRVASQDKWTTKSIGLSNYVTVSF